MTRQQFIFLNIGILGLLGIAFYWGRRNSKAPSNLRVTPPSNLSNLKQVNLNLVSNQDQKNEQDHFKLQSAENSDGLFIYNGHTWNAYEVLGLPSGCSMDDLRVTFEQALLRSQDGSHEFLKAALSAILFDLKNQRQKTK